MIKTGIKRMITVRSDSPGFMDIAKAKILSGGSVSIHFAPSTPSGVKEGIMAELHSFRKKYINDPKPIRHIDIYNKKVINTRAGVVAVNAHCPACLGTGVVPDDNCASGVKPCEHCGVQL